MYSATVKIARNCAKKMIVYPSKLTFLA
ncbi:MAG: hypothetical protein ACJAZJ_000574, partial [Candidatus Endobugula sp.]